MEKLTINIGSSVVVIESIPVVEHKLTELETQCKMAMTDCDGLTALCKDLKHALDVEKSDNVKMDEMLSKIADAIITHVHPQGYKNEDLVDIACNCIENHTKLNTQINYLIAENTSIKDEIKLLQRTISSENAVASVTHVNHPVDYSTESKEVASKPKKKTGSLTYPKPVNKKACAICGKSFLPYHNRVQKCDICRWIVAADIESVEPIIEEQSQIPSDTHVPSVDKLRVNKKGAIIIEPLAQDH